LQRNGKRKEKGRAMITDNKRQVVDLKRKYGHNSINFLSIETKAKSIAKGRPIREVYLVVDYATMDSNTQEVNMCRIGQVKVSDTR
jgi:hypothetical protein